MILKLEDKVTEYKAAASEIPKDLWSTYSAFANTEGGKIILGVSLTMMFVGIMVMRKIGKIEM